MSAAVLGAVLATALNAGILALDSATLSNTALVGAAWVALAPFLAGLAERPWPCALVLLAVAAPQVALGVAADHGGGASLERLLPLAAAALVWSAALGAASNASVRVGRSERWLCAWSALSVAGPLVALALSAGGDGGEHWLPGSLTRLSPIFALIAAAPLRAPGAAGLDALGVWLLPSAALVVATWLSKVSFGGADHAVREEVGDGS
jgi:hypothetical protein